MTLERLIGDGRIHPARIEETVEKCRHDLELQMKREGERAVMELGIHGLHPDLIKLIGRLKYRTSFGQNALTHSMEVAWVAGLLAGEMGVNVTMARRAGLLHDIGKALDHEIEGSHVQIGVDICRKYKENTQIIHAIEAHHGDVEPKTPLAFIIQAADAISAARPGARRENVESYVKRLENLEEISSSFEGVEQAFAVQAGREVRILVKPDVISDDQVILLARAIAKKDRGYAGLPRPDQGQRHPREPRCGVRKIKPFPQAAVFFARQPVFCAKTIAIPVKKRYHGCRRKQKELRPCGRRPATTPERKGASFYEKLEEITGLPAGRLDGTDRVHRLRCQRRRTDEPQALGRRKRKGAVQTVR